MSITLKKSSVSGRVPVVGDLDYGELALNYTDGLLYFKDSSNSIKSFAASGASGAQGGVGYQGATGVQGLSGATGVQGLSGATGVQGNLGATGVQGLSGATGIEGATGVQGNLGATGLSGATGVQGLSGATGVQGLNGATGLEGATGVQGLSGATGIQGSTGIGATGFQGATGVAGAGLEVASITGITQGTPVQNVTRLLFDQDTGFNLTEITTGVVKVALGSTFKTWKVTGQQDLVAIGEDTIRIVAGSGISLTTNPYAAIKTLTINSTGGGGGGTVVLGNLDGGLPNSNYGGITMLDAGGI